MFITYTRITQNYPHSYAIYEIIHIVCINVYTALFISIL